MLVDRGEAEAGVVERKGGVLAPYQEDSGKPAVAATRLIVALRKIAV